MSGALISFVVSALAAGVADADAAQRHTLVAGANWDTGGGVHLANRPGGFYMGRAWPSNRFDRTSYDTDRDGQPDGDGITRSDENGSDYVWGWSVDRGRQCFWLGPARHVYNVTWPQYLSLSSSSASDRCPDDQRRALNDPAASLGSHFNCDPGQGAGPAWTRMKSTTAFYYNVTWDVRDGVYYAGSGEDQSGTVAADQQVQYRYTTKDGNWSVIFVPGKGWGFVAASAVPHVRGWWGYEGETEQYALCEQPAPTPDSGRAPAGPPMPSSDFSGDGRTDVVVRRADGTLQMYRGDGAGGWLTGNPEPIGSGWNMFDIVLYPGDVSGDGKADLLARKPDGTLWRYRGNGAGGWITGNGEHIGNGWGSQYFDRIIGGLDFSGDGRADLLAREPGGALWLYRGNGTGGWLGAEIVGTGWHEFDALVAVRDFSGDRRADVIARKHDGTLWLYHGDGDRGWRYGGTPTRIGDGWERFSALFGGVDFSGDGYADILARGTDGTLWMYRGNGQGGWVTGNGDPIGTGWGIFDALMAIA